MQRESGVRSSRRARQAYTGIALVGAASLAVLGLSVTAASAGTVTAASTSVDTARAAAYDAYHQTLAPALAVPMTWSGSASACQAGAASPQAQDATLTAINYFRHMEGLTAVTFDPTLSADAEQAALIMLAQGDLSHDPPSTWKCWTQAGHDAAASSNLYLGRTGADAIAGYMTDPGVSSAGHRRWVLYPAQRVMGSGSTSGSNALYVFGTQDSSDTGPSFMPYPAAGDFPAQIEPQGQWSLSAPDADFHNATVTVSSNGQNLPVTIQPVSDGYGENTLVWQFDPGYQMGGADQDYAVTVDNIVIGGTATSYSYTTRLFDASIDHRSTITFPTPTSMSVGGTQALRATSSSGLAVTYTSTTPDVCSVNGSSVQSIAAGTCTINADQSGDDTYSAAPTVARSFAVSAAPASSVSINGPANQTATYGKTVTVSGSSTPGAAVGVWFNQAGTSGFTQRRNLTATSSGAWSTTYVAGADYRIYATSGTAQSSTIQVQVSPTITGATSLVVRKKSTYTIRGTGIPGATVTIHFHKAGTAATDYSILRTVTVASNGTWSRSYVASVDYRFFASLPNGQVSPTVLVQAR
jgi:uncharacterized protein YkwD